MAYELSTRARLKSQSNNIKQQIILEIEGIDLIFGAIDVGRLILFDDDIAFDDAGLFFDGALKDPKSRAWISLAKTSKSISQQLLQDKGGTGSVSSVKIELIDKNGELTRIFKPKAAVEDILSCEARVYLAFEGGVHPEDSTNIFNGIIDDIAFAAGSVVVNIAHPDQLKRQEILPKVSAELVGAIDEEGDYITLSTVIGLVEESYGKDSILEAYIKIDDEIIRYAGIISSVNSLIECQRGQLGTVAAAHDDGAEVESFYVLKGPPVELALGLMLSGRDLYFKTGVTVTGINTDGAGNKVPNAVAFTNKNIKEELNLSAGDFIKLAGTGPNAVDTDREIVSFGTTEVGSYIVVNENVQPGHLYDETEIDLTASFKSQFIFTSLLGGPATFGCGMLPFHVDIENHIKIRDMFGSSFPEYEFYLKDTVKAKEFIEEQIYFPAGLYQLPRKGRASVGITLPPIAEEGAKVIDIDNVLNADKLSISRSINSNFYNAVVYKYQEHPTEDKFLAGNITYSNTSANRIKVGTKPLTIEAKGLRRSPLTESFIKLQTRRFLDRYQFAAEKIPVEVNYKTGFNTEVGDTVIFGSPDLKMSDIKSGTRSFQPRIMEIVNKSMDFITGKIRLDLLDTAFELDGRYGVVSPSSYVKEGSSESHIIIKRSFSTKQGRPEREKWANYIGETILIYAPDWSESEEKTLIGFDLVNPDKMLIDSPLSFTPQEGYIITAPNYPETDDARVNATWKRIHCFLCPQIAIVSGASETELTVNSADTPTFKVGSILLIHNNDYSITSEEVTVGEVNGDSIVLSESLEFIPDNTMMIDLVGFMDSGLPYRLI